MEIPRENSNVPEKHMVTMICLLGAFFVNQNKSIGMGS